MNPPVLCINLTSAATRWQSIVDGVKKHLPASDLYRIPAVNWRDLPVGLENVSLTLFTRYLLQHPQRQSTHRASHRQLDTPSSVAIMMSHIKCWDWILSAHASLSLCLFFSFRRSVPPDTMCRTP